MESILYDHGACNARHRIDQLTQACRAFLDEPYTARDVRIIAVLVQVPTISEIRMIERQRRDEGKPSTGMNEPHTSASMSSSSSGARKSDREQPTRSRARVHAAQSQRAHAGDAGKCLSSRQRHARTAQRYADAVRRRLQTAREDVKRVAATFAGRSSGGKMKGVTQSVSDNFSFTPFASFPASAAVTVSSAVAAPKTSTVGETTNTKMKESALSLLSRKCTTASVLHNSRHVQLLVMAVLRPHSMADWAHYSAWQSYMKCPLQNSPLRWAHALLLSLSSPEFMVRVATATDMTAKKAGSASIVSTGNNGGDRRKIRLQDVVLPHQTLFLDLTWCLSYDRVHVIHDDILAQMHINGLTTGAHASHMGRPQVNATTCDAQATNRSVRRSRALQRARQTSRVSNAMLTQLFFHEVMPRLQFPKSHADMHARCVLWLSYVNILPRCVSRTVPATLMRVINVGAGFADEKAGDRCMGVAAPSIAAPPETLYQAHADTFAELHATCRAMYKLLYSAPGSEGSVKSWPLCASFGGEVSLLQYSDDRGAAFPARYVRAQRDVYALVGFLLGRDRSDLYTNAVAFCKLMLRRLLTAQAIAPVEQASVYSHDAGARTPIDSRRDTRATLSPRAHNMTVQTSTGCSNLEEKSECASTAASKRSTTRHHRVSLSRRSCASASDAPTTTDSAHIRHDDGEGGECTTLAVGTGARRTDNTTHPRKRCRSVPQRETDGSPKAAKSAAANAVCAKQNAPATDVMERLLWSESI